MVVNSHRPSRAGLARLQEGVEVALGAPQAQAAVRRLAGVAGQPPRAEQGAVGSVVSLPRS